MPEKNKPNSADVMPTNDDDVLVQQLHAKSIQDFNNAKSLVNSLKIAAMGISDPQLQSLQLFCIALSESYGALLDYLNSNSIYSLSHQSLDTKAIVQGATESINACGNESAAAHSATTIATLKGYSVSVVGGL